MDLVLLSFQFVWFYESLSVDPYIEQAAALRTSHSRLFSNNHLLTN